MDSVAKATVPAPRASVWSFIVSAVEHLGLPVPTSVVFYEDRHAVTVDLTTPADAQRWAALAGAEHNRPVPYQDRLLLHSWHTFDGPGGWYVLVKSDEPLPAHLVAGALLTPDAELVSA